jgi:hypothetical protein
MCPSCKSEHWTTARTNEQGRRVDLTRSLRKHIDAETLLRLTMPIIEALEREGRKHVARFSPGTIAKLAYELQCVVDELARPDVTEGTRRRDVIAQQQRKEQEKEARRSLRKQQDDDRRRHHRG